jgi:protein TonB
VALAVNLGFFAGMPHLLHRAPAKPMYAQRLDQVTVIRIRRPDTPVNRKTVKADEPKPTKAVPKQAVKPDRLAKLRLALPFEINPRLPAAPAALALTPVEGLFGDATDFGDVFEASQLDTPLTILARIPPLYPLKAKRQGIEGWVRIRFLVNEDGGVEEVTVVESRPPGVFEQAVKGSVSRWRFQPGLVDGIPVRTQAETTIRFELK